ncbi:MAG: hypothetical protein M1832_002735 [Thelocarpon impressellum]|nr:MAG: hypothetical protein M1832_002735 [Thelocarpon impressellum]
MAVQFRHLSAQAFTFRLELPSMTAKMKLLGLSVFSLLLACPPASCRGTARAPLRARQDPSPEQEERTDPEMTNLGTVAHSRPVFRFSFDEMKLHGNLSAFAGPAKPDDLRLALDEFIERASSHPRDEQTGYAKMDARNLSLIVAAAPGQALRWGQVQAMARYLPTFYRMHRSAFDRTVIGRVVHPPHQSVYTVLIVNYFEVSSEGPIDAADTVDAEPTRAADRALQAAVTPVAMVPMFISGGFFSMAYHFTSAVAPYADFKALLANALSVVGADPFAAPYHGLVLRGEGVALTLQCMVEMSPEYVQGILHGVRRMMEVARPAGSDMTALAHSVEAAIYSDADGLVVAKLGVVAVGTTALVALAQQGMSRWMGRLVARCTLSCVVTRTEL